MLHGDDDVHASLKNNPSQPLPAQSILSLKETIMNNDETQSNGDIPSNNDTGPVPYVEAVAAAAKINAAEQTAQQSSEKAAEKLNEAATASAEAVSASKAAFKDKLKEGVEKAKKSVNETKEVVMNDDFRLGAMVTLVTIFIVLGMTALISMIFSTTPFTAFIIILSIVFVGAVIDYIFAQKSKSMTVTPAVAT